MPTIVPALAANGPGEPLVVTAIERRDPKAHDVVIDIAFVGICHSDIHQARAEWAPGIFPMVPGHEITGIVSAVGDSVDRYLVGDRVGVGCFVDSCRECENCRAGEEQHCRRGEVETYNGRAYDGSATYGGYSTQIVVHQDYVLRIPDGLELDVAAPLLCAGITLYSPLIHWQVGPGTRVCLVGLGGLGHAGVKIAHALGAEVTVLSQTLNKREDGLRFGADRYFATTDPQTFTDLAYYFDVIVNTVSTNLDLDAHLALLRLNGSLINVGMPSQPDQFRVFSLAGGRRSIAASKNGGIRQTQEMLEFCGSHGIGAEVEVIGVDDVNDAYERVLRSDVRYRFVIDVTTFATD